MSENGIPRLKQRYRDEVVGQLKDGSALDLPRGMLRVLCVETDDPLLYLFEGVGYIVDPLPNNPWVDGDGSNYAH